MFIFVGYLLEPFNCVVSAAPEINFSGLHNRFVDSIQDFNPTKSETGIISKHKSAGRFVNEIGFVVFQCDKGVFACC